MEREGLDRLSREELLELLAQQAEVIGRQQTELAAREAAIERRDEKIRELEEELSQFRRPAKTPENSSVPPSRGQKANRVEGWRRKLGPKRGHLGVSRMRSEPDVVVECRPRVCWLRPDVATDRGASDGAESGHRGASVRTGGDRSMAVHRGLRAVWRADRRHLSARAGATADVRSWRRGAAELLPRAASRQP